MVSSFVRSSLLAVVACTLGGCITINGSWNDYSVESEPFTNSIDITPGDTVSIVAAAGRLDITAAPGNAVIVTAVAAASDEETLQQVGFLLDPVADGVQVSVDIPSNARAKLDLSVQVPRGCHVRIDDGSGSITIREVASVSIDDGSGSITIHDVAGDVVIRDGSGSISIAGVGGQVSITDGSGSISVERVARDVIVESDGSGSIMVHDVGGDFRVLDDGSGSVSHHGVSGAVWIDD